LLAVVLFAAIWGLALAAMAWLTANPVTLNFHQIAVAPFVVTATVEDPQTGRVTVEREWKHSRALEDITIDNLNQTGARAGGRYLIPLAKAEGERYLVAETPIEGAAPLIYPATAEAISQLDAILAHLDTLDISPAEEDVVAPAPATSE
jgi:hypothetical protein